jgi:hypothetical protein
MLAVTLCMSGPPWPSCIPGALCELPRLNCLPPVRASHKLRRLPHWRLCSIKEPRTMSPVQKTRKVATPLQLSTISCFRIFIFLLPLVDWFNKAGETYYCSFNRFVFLGTFVMPCYLVLPGVYGHLVFGLGLGRILAPTTWRKEGYYIRKIILLKACAYTWLTPLCPIYHKYDFMVEKLALLYSGITKSIIIFLKCYSKCPNTALAQSFQHGLPNIANQPHTQLAQSLI